MHPAPPPPPPRSVAEPSPWAGVLVAIAAVLVGLWIVAATAGVQVLGWFVGELALGLGLSVPVWVWPVVALVNTAVVAGPAGLLWGLSRSLRAKHWDPSRRLTPHSGGVRAAGKAWTVVGLSAGALGMARAVPVVHNEVLLLLTTIVAAGLAMVVRRLGKTAPGVTAAGNAGFGVAGFGVTGFGVAAGLLVLLPWLRLGALGGLTETVLAATASAAVGWLGATILNGSLFAAYARSRPWQVLVGGLVAGVTLAPLGAAVGGHGVNVAGVIALPALGFAAAALAASVAPHRLPGQPIMALVGLAVFGPLAFVDPEETTLLLGESDVGFWALVASVLSVAVALVTGTVYGLALRGRPARWIPAGTALLVAIAATAGYGLAGQPGLHGERLLVILSGQADLSGLDTIPDRSARLRATYSRLVEHADRTQAPLRESLDRWALSYTPYYLVNAIGVDGGPIVRQWLSARSDVDRVLLDQRLRPLPVPIETQRGSEPTPNGSPQWNVSMVGADRVWRDLGATGSGIVVGTSDSGVDGDHPDLRDGFRGGDDSWYDPWNATATPVDHNGHGTHTIASALGRRGIGIAPQARWIGCVNLDRNLGSPSLYLGCLQFMMAPFPHGGNPLRDGRPDRAPHVLTNSWGCPDLEGCDPSALQPATAALRAAGIFFVAAAGNTGPFCSSVDDPPAAYTDVFTVGAVDRTRTVTEFSSRGPTDDGRTKPDVVAPGAAILSAMPGGTYGSLDGTSMATPHVAGVVALMWSANPRLVGRVDETARILRETATRVEPTSASSSSRPADACGAEANITGAGLVDAYAAVARARAVAPLA
jgi:subtilisin family serine protease